MCRPKILLLASRLGDEQIVSDALRNDADTLSLLKTLANIDTPNLSFEVFVKYRVPQIFNINRTELINDLLELGRNISSSKELRRAVRLYVQERRAQFESQARTEAEDWFCKMASPRRRKRFHPNPELKYLKGN